MTGLLSEVTLLTPQYNAQATPPAIGAQPQTGDTASDLWSIRHSYDSA